MNKTIEYELSSFHELVTLDIQGYQKNSTENYSHIYLNYTALLGLQLLQYVNIQHIRMIPNPDLKNKEIPKSAYDYLRTISRQYSNEIPQISTNLTFAIPDEPEILPYNVYKMQNSIISTFSHLSNLKFLRLYECHLETITWEMFDGLVAMETLSLEGNDIIEIPEFAFYGMPNLKILILSNNKLTNIRSETLAGLFHLEHLDISRNQLHHLSDTTFAPLPKLTSLDIRDNPITEVDASTFEVTNGTRVLFIGNENNALNLHSYALNGLNELEKLLIYGLNVPTLQKSLLKGTPNLKYLELRGKIDSIYFDAFTGSLLLETLILKNCSLKSISMDTFYGLTNLKILDLSDNQLQSLPSGVFDMLSSLDEIILTNNKLTSLPFHVFSKVTNVKMIRLDENPWNCSCKLFHWPPHAVNKVKHVRMTEKCNYRYDKTPCHIESEQYYAYNSQVVPKCKTPTMYEGWNALHVVHKKLNCRKRSKHGKLRKNSQQVDMDKSFDKSIRSFVNDENNDLMAAVSDDGSLKSEQSSGSFVQHRNIIREVLKASNEDVNMLVNSQFSTSSSIEKATNKVQDL